MDEDTVNGWMGEYIVECLSAWIDGLIDERIIRCMDERMKWWKKGRKNKWIKNYLEKRMNRRVDECRAGGMQGCMNGGVDEWKNE